MVLTDAVETGGAPQDHYFDETRNPNPTILPETSSSEEGNLPPINYSPQLVRGDNGSLYWTE